MIGYLFILLMSSNIYANQCGKSGLEIMQEQEKVQKVDFEEVSQQLTLKNLASKSSEEKIRQMKRYLKDKDDDVKSLISFFAPTDIKGTALLNWDNKDRDDDQWLYLPGLRKLQRIASSGKRKYFLGTDFTYVDLENESLQDYNYNCTKIVKCGGSDQCYRIEAEPKNKEALKKTGYQKRILYIQNDALYTKRVVFYDLKGKKLKTLTNTDWKNLSGKVYRSYKSVMERHGVQQTTIQVVEHKIGNKIDDSTFTERYLNQQKHIR